MKLLELYENLLKAAFLATTEDGYVSRKFGDQTDPAIIKGKRLVLPTQEHLANPNKKDIILFHPLSENILKGESVVLEEFRTSLNIRLNFTIGLIAFQLLQIATSTKEHAKLTPDQSEFLSDLKNADEKTLDTFGKLLKAMNVSQNQNVFVSIFLKRSGSVGGKKYQRAGIVAFPFYEELMKSTTELYGVKLRVKDRETFIKLMEYIFPNIGVPESHNRGSDSDVAPFLDALMKAVMTVSAPLNDQITLFSNFLDSPEEMMVNDEWVEVFDNLGVMLPQIRSIPMQAGSEPVMPKNESELHTTVPVIQTTPVAASPLPAALTNPPAQTVWSNYQPPAAMTFNNGQQPLPGSNGIVRTANGINFESVLRSNPVLAQTVGGVGVNLNANFQRVEPPPSWARGGFQQNTVSGVFGQMFQQQPPINNFGMGGRGFSTTL